MEHQEAPNTLGLSTDSVSQPEDTEAVGPGSSELTGTSPAPDFVSLQIFVWKLSAQPVTVGGCSGLAHPLDGILDSAGLSFSFFLI